MEIPRNFRAKRPASDLGKAAQTWARAEFQSPKGLAHALGLSIDEARSTFDGRASKTTLSKIINRAGWAAALVIVADVAGRGLEQHIEELRSRHAEADQRHGALLNDLRALDASAGAYGYRADDLRATRRVRQGGDLARQAPPRTPR